MRDRIWGGGFLLFAAVLAILAPEHPDSTPLVLVAAGVSGLVGAYLYIRTHEDMEGTDDDGHRPGTWRG